MRSPTPLAPAVVLALAVLLGGCFLAPSPAADRPLSYRAPIPGWVRHDIDSTLSLSLPPEMERQPRADAAFAPVFFLSDSAHVAIWLGESTLPVQYEVGSRAVGEPVDALRNGNQGSFLRFRPEGADASGRAAYYVSMYPANEFDFYASKSRAFRTESCPRVSVLIVAEYMPGSFSADRVWDFVRLRCPTRPVGGPLVWGL